MTAEDVEKWVALGEGLLETLLVVLPESELKNKVKALEGLLESEELKGAVNAGFKLYEKVKSLLK
jgi:hypothetical protein